MRWLRDLSFRWKLGVPVAVLTLILVVVAGLSMSLLGTFAHDARIYSGELMPGGSRVLEADRDLHQSLIAQRRALQAGNAQERKEQRAVQAENLTQARERVARAAELLGDPRAAKLAAQFDKEIDRWAEINSRVRSLVDDGRVDEAVQLASGDGAEQFDTARNQLDQMTGRVNDMAAELSAQVEADAVSSRITLTTALLIGLAVCVAILIVLPRSVLKPLQAMSARVEDLSSGEGDLTIRLANPARDEIGRLSDRIDDFLGTLNEMVSRAADTTKQLSSAAEELASTSRETQSNVDAQHDATDQVGTATNEMTATVQEVARNVGEAAESAGEATREANDMAATMERTVTTVEELARQLDRTGEGVSRLTADAEQIGTVLDVINAVAEQTNLLALNAAIEAARAGEHGRGFAVVAEEVRTLATRTQDSTNEIRDIIERVQSGARESSQLMETGRQQSGETVTMVRGCGEQLETVTAGIQSISDMTSQIASAAEEQSSTIEEINRNITEISEISGRTATGAGQVSTASDELARLASELEGLMGRFRTG
ncbi:hypothetical protein KBTX_02072 [wastewater metagenome]|uniref:Methyl-accepting chemotaxis protein McpQ n=2 Tax=unclassified sequences TaxID=12908 RepID=A0A5B8RCU2_9ZZZZ|nr:methyl-accepting chemotaxis protein [Arhodomonas aquaeolei]MCS4505492.1 methyl-accepting chemotaxis protein [Arhodomonas aquaeolei]QEA05748.1 hypothetical protein KBTEX_02072 [uncultured organism]